MPARVAWNRALAQRLGLHREIDFGVDVGGVQGHVTEPGADRVDVNTRAQQVDGGRMPITCGLTRLAAIDGTLRRSRPVPFHQVVDSKARDGFAAAIQEDGLVPAARGDERLECGLSRV
jgi:hypothetical protein